MKELILLVVVLAGVGSCSYFSAKRIDARINQMIAQDLGESGGTMKFIEDTFILALLFLALYFVALGIKYTVNLIPRAFATAMEQVK